MGSCLCPGDSESQYLAIKAEKKRFLPKFEGEKLKIKEKKSASKNFSNDNIFDETKNKNTPANLIYCEESPTLPKGEKKTASFEHFNIKKIIGKGSYGRVLLVEKKDTGIIDYDG